MHIIITKTQQRIQVLSENNAKLEVADQTSRRNNQYDD